MEQFIIKEGKSLRLGYTTGSCAAAAAKAACFMLLTGRDKAEIDLMTPKGIALHLPVEERERSDDYVQCAIRKDAGDDPDMTDGMLVFARVQRSGESGVHIEGGVGIGRVTKPGLDQPVGAAAINSVPRKMILENVQEVLDALDVHCGIQVLISAPQGVEIAKKTFNPRLGIEGGLSILGTTGIVEPMSEQALVDTIHVELRQRRATGADSVLLTPGNYGFDYLRDDLHLQAQKAVLTSNFIGESIDFCRELGFSRVLLVGHIGKLVKLAGNMMNTHSKYGDCRLPLLAAHAAAAGTDTQTVRQMLACVSCDEGVRLLREAGTDHAALQSLSAAIDENLRHRAGSMEIGFLCFSKEYGLLAHSENVDALMKDFRD